MLIFSVKDNQIRPTFVGEFSKLLFWDRTTGTRTGGNNQFVQLPPTYPELLDRGF